jgi:hypothetical protein
MININALDNVIAVVVVILLLSLIVQAVQSAFKKALKIKSRQIEDSLVDLFENVLHYDPKKADAAGSQVKKPWLVRITEASPILRSVYELLSRRLHPSNPAAHPDLAVRTLFEEVTKGLQQVGRVAQSGNRMLDSVSKDDLKKVMGKVLPDSLYQGFSAKLKTVCVHIGRLDDAVKLINEKYLGNLSGEANAKFAAMQQSLAPLLNDLRVVCNGQELTPALIVEDISRLRDIKMGDALAILGDIQQKVETDLTQVNKDKTDGNAPAADRLTELTGLSSALGSIAQALTELSKGLDAALTPLRAKLGEVETWYDTVMQSFEERYTRGMKTWAIVISFLVVAYLNANVFTIYKNISANDALRSKLVQLGEERAKVREASIQANDKTEATQALTAVSKELENAEKQMAEYSSLGFQPLSWQGVKERLNPGRWTKIDQDWFNRRKEDFKTIFGWMIMTLLLSVGAPFWQDTLESLFGVKNLLRKKSDTKNVEAESGAGQPKP